MFAVFRKMQYSVVMLVVVGFLNGLATAYLHVAAYSLCLSRFGTESVVYSLLIASIALPGVGWVWLKMMRRCGFTVVLAAGSGLMCSLILVLWLANVLVSSGLGALALVFLDELINVFLCLGFWELASRALGRNAKGSSFVLVSAGFPLARAAGGVSSVALTQLLSTGWLLPISALTMALAAIPAVLLARGPGIVGQDAEGKSGDGDAVSPSDAEPSGSKRHLNLLIFLFVVVSVLASVFLQDAYRCALSSCFTNDGDLAHQFGVMESLTGIVQVLCMVGLATRFLDRFGPGAGLVVMPSTVVIGAFAVLVIAGSSGEPCYVFLAASLTRLTDKVCRASLQRPSLMSLYGILTPNARSSLMATVDTTVKPLASVGATTLLVLVKWLPGTALLRATQATAVIAVFWSASAVLLCARYELRNRRNERAEPSSRAGPDDTERS